MAQGLKLDLTRGKPAAAQLDLSNELLNLPRGVVDQAGVDTRNYGGLEGIAELRAMFADLLWVEPEQVVAGGSSSLVMMREVLTDLWLKGAVDGERPWGAGGEGHASSARCPATTGTSPCWTGSASRW